MFLLEPEETRWDLRWRMFGTPVRVHPLFWLVALLLGYDAFHRLGNGYLVMWVACVFVSILLHEFGHVLVGRLFGSHGYIVLYSLGGIAIGSNQVPRRWQRVLVLLAGPGFQLVLWAAVWFGLPWYGPRVPAEWLQPVGVLTFMLVEINLFWALLNLLPIWPLDGGQIARELFVAALGERGVYHSLGLSMVVSGILALHMLLSAVRGQLLLPWVPGGGWFSVFFFVMFFVNSLTAMQAESGRARHWTDDDWPYRR